MAKKDFKSGLNALLSKPTPRPAAPQRTPKEATAAAIEVDEPSNTTPIASTGSSGPTSATAYWSAELDKKLDRVARFKSKTKSEVVKEAIEFYLKFQVEVD